jgi:hypothetical protein
MSDSGAAANKAVATALVEALMALRKATDQINVAIAAIDSGYVPPTRQMAAQRTTSTQIMAILAGTGEPMTLIDIADGVVALRRDEDTPKGRGGTRYQEMCRTALRRLIDRGLVGRVEPTDPRGLMRFQRIS